MTSTGPGARTCYRHPDAVAGVVCQRCDRPICPRCMNQASVGFHCPECLKEHSTRVVTGRGLTTFKPVVTMVLIGMSVTVWLLGQIIWRPADIMTTSEGALARGGLVSSAIEVSRSSQQILGTIGVANGEWYRLVSSGFMHAGIFHLAVNMWALWILGQITEKALGRSQMIMVYLVALMGGSFGALLVSPDVQTVGASGAIFGLMGGLLMVARARGIAMRDTGLLGVLGINLVLTFVLAGTLSVGGHIGGLIGGGLAAFLIVDVPQRVSTLKGKAEVVYQWTVTVVVIVALAVGSVALAKAADTGPRPYVASASPARVEVGPVRSVATPR